MAQEQLGLREGDEQRRVGAARAVEADDVADAPRLRCCATGVDDDVVPWLDVQLAGGETYRESSTFRPGDRTVIAQTPWGRLGMTICYDLRFPHLYRDLAHAGAEMISIPSSFTVPTGRAHWHVLLRARAIENLCYVAAVNRIGTDGNGLAYDGDSAVIDYLGLAQVEAHGREQVLTTTLPASALAAHRERFPAMLDADAFELRP